jgi:hypothetical protein
MGFVYRGYLLNGYLLAMMSLQSDLSGWPPVQTRGA